MMALMNYLTAYAEDTYSKNVWIKCHCSQGQYCTHYNDPVSGMHKIQSFGSELNFSRLGKPLNFNFLPYYADPRLNIFPHTVQFYTFDDPAWTYGNENFSYMFDFIFENVGKRNVRTLFVFFFIIQSL